MSSMQQLSKKQHRKISGAVFLKAADSFGQSFIDWSMYMS